MKKLSQLFVHLHTLDLFVPPENQNHTNCKTLSLPHHMNMIPSRNWEEIIEVNKKTSKIILCCPSDLWQSFLVEAL